MEGTRADGVKIYCLCREPLGDGTMYGCDACDGWYHERCISKFVDTSAHIDLFICPKCTVEYPTPENPQRRVTTYKRTCGNRGCRNVCDVQQKKKFCSQACAVKWGRRVLEKEGREAKRRIKGLLEQCPEGMAQFTGAKPGAVPGIDVPMMGQSMVEESPYWKRLNLRWDTDDMAETLREELKASYLEDNGGYKHLHDKTVSKQKDIIRVVESQREDTKYRSAFFEAAKRASKAFCASYKIEHGMEKLPPNKGKPSMHNPPNDICGYDYRLHANDAWHESFRSSEEGQAVMGGTQELGLDTSGQIHTIGGVETVDPATIEGTICIKTKCRPHYDWAATAAAAHKNSAEIYDEAISDAEAMIAKMEEILEFKIAVSRLRANWIKMQLKKLSRAQLEHLKSIRGNQMNGDLVALFSMHYKEVLSKMAGEIPEPAQEKSATLEKEDEEMKKGSDDEEDETTNDRTATLEAARNERRNAKRRETRKAQREKAARSSSKSASQTPSRDLGEEKEEEEEEDVKMEDIGVQD